MGCIIAIQGQVRFHPVATFTTLTHHVGSSVEGLHALSPGPLAAIAWLPSFAKSTSCGRKKPVIGHIIFYQVITSAHSVDSLHLHGRLQLLLVKQHFSGWTYAAWDRGFLPGLLDLQVQFSEQLEQLLKQLRLLSCQTNIDGT